MHSRGASFALIAIGRRMDDRSALLLRSIEGGLPRLMRLWIALALVASLARIALSPLHGQLPDLATLAPYLLLVAAPVASMLLALRWFGAGKSFPQPRLRLAVLGRWRALSATEATAHPSFGASGWMVSLLLGILIGIPLRASEYLATMPALAGPVPAWLATLHAMLTIDVVLLNSLYVVALVAALRRVPSFPRLLLATWTADLAMQLAIAEVAARSGDLPPAVGHALYLFLDGNIQKLLIGVALWLPYLLLSTRVNLTYRHRLPA